MSHTDDQPVYTTPPSLDDKAELKVAPLDVSAASCPRNTLPDLSSRSSAPSEQQPEQIRYSLRELMVLVTVAAVLFASMRWIGAALFAAVAGVLGFIMLVVISVAKPSRGVIHVAWVVLMIVYAVACVAALIDGQK